MPAEQVISTRKFLLIRDVNVAQQYTDAGLLWWVSYQEGGKAVITCPFGPWKVLGTWCDGSVGILLED